MSIIILYILIIFILCFCYLRLNIRENLENDNDYKKYFGQCIGPNCNKKKTGDSKDCIGGWLPWSKELVDKSTREIRNVCKKTNDLDLPVFYRSYKIITPERFGGEPCKYKNGEIQDIDCNLPKPDDCLEIRARYYGTEEPTIEQIKSKCNMGNCIPAKKVTASCDSDIIEEGTGLNRSVKKRCPWICDPRLAINGDGINTCRYDIHCSSCVPRQSIDNTNCGDAINCPNPNAPDGCGYYNLKRSGINIEQIDLTDRDVNDYPNVESIPDYKSYVEADEDIFTANNYYDKIKIDKPDIYKASSCYYPYNSMYEL